jgi:DNA polymerase III subunit gamma/tau
MHALDSVTSVEEPTRCMSYQVLARKWRPRTFAEMVGQEHVVRALSNALQQDRLHHAYLFTGTRGVGKTSLARILAKSLNCETGVTPTPCGVCSACREIDEGRFVDLLEVDAASKTGVDDTRELLENVPYAPVRGRYKVYLIDEVHMFSGHSFNALLKTLEEPPPHVKFLLATTDPQKVPVTVLSRCLQFNLKRLPLEQIEAQFRHVLGAEGIDAEAEALALLARAADGSMRDGLSLLDQALAGSGKLVEPDVRDMLGSVEQRHVHAILEALAACDAAAAIAAVGEVFAQARGMGQLLTDLAEALHRIALIQQLPDYRDDSRADWDELVALAGRLDPEDLQLWYQIAVTGRRDLSLAPTERSGCEMTILRMFAFQPAESPAGGADGGGSPARASGEVAAAGGSASGVPGASASNTTPAAAVADHPAPPPAELSAANWPEVLADLSLSDSFRTVAGLLVVAKFERPQVVFTAERDDMILISERFRKALESAMSEWAGETLKISIQPVDDTALATPAALEERQIAETQADAEVAIDQDPFVQRLVEQFDAEVVRESIRPIQTRSH